MRASRQFARLISFFLLFSTTATQNPSVSDILRTNQYVIVGQQNDFTVVESDVPTGTFPKLITHPRIETGHHYNYKGFHLIRDPDGSQSPKMMIVTTANNHYQSHIFEISNPDFSKIFVSSQKRSSAKFLQEWKGVLPVKFGFGFDSSVAQSFYDSYSQMVYFDLSSSHGQLNLVQAYLNRPFHNDTNLIKIAHHEEKKVKDRFDWQEDQYAGKFYYKEVVDGKIALFVVPMRRFIQAYSGIESGKLVEWPFENSKILGVSDGVFFLIKRAENGGQETVIIWNSVTGIQLEDQRDGISPQFERIIVVKNNDFCMWRNASMYEKSECEQQRKLYQKESEEDGLSIVAWLLIACFILFTTIVLLCVYIYWLRTSFVLEDDEFHPNEHETEASLFVSKQRSFAASYADPALLDVSVDKWNQ